MDGYEISGLPFVVTGTSDEEMARSALGVREQIAFYASTPATGRCLTRTAGARCRRS